MLVRFYDFPSLESLALFFDTRKEELNFREVINVETRKTFFGTQYRVWIQYLDKGKKK